MVKGDAVYNKHFVSLVMCALTCGLTHPIEWLTDWDRDISVDYDTIPEREEFSNIAWREFFLVFHMRYPKDSTELQSWVDKYYKRG